MKMFNKKKNKKQKITHLSGSPKEQAKQLFELLKDRSLDIDSLKLLLPNNVEVIKEFISCLQTDMKSNQAAYERVITIFEESIHNLNEIIKDGKITDSEKERCHEELLNLHKLMIEFHNEHEKRLYDFWKDISKYVFLLLGIIIIIASGGRINKLPTKS